MRAAQRLCAIIIAAMLVAALRGSAIGTVQVPPPLVVTASAGPAAGSHIVATVTRIVGGAMITLPAALVPALQPGDIVDLDFPDYRHPPARVKYHVNAAFITEAAPQHWLFERSGPADQLFAGRPHRARNATTANGKIHFVYGMGNRRGIPIFFIVPEDAQTRGVDGVRDYVDAHPTDFVDMSQSTNAAVDHYSFLSDFLGSLANGSIDPATSQQRVETVAQSLGVSPASIDACYAAGGSSAVVDNCVQQTINGVVDQTNFTAPTQAQFLGGVAGAAAPLGYAPYIASLLTVWRLFVHTGHQEYEYLPTTLTLADPTTAHTDELLMGLKVPTIRPPGAVSVVLFFTIGDPQASQTAPVIVNAAPAAGICARTARISVPLHLDRTSRYVNDAAFVATPDGGSASRIALDPRTLSAPTIERSRLPASGDGAYTVSLTGRFGFDSIMQPAPATVHVAIPGSAPWALAAVPHHPAVAGGSLDIVATSAAAPCLSRAELQIGSAEPVALTATHLDAHRVELRASLANLPAGPAAVRFYQDDTDIGRDIETEAVLTIGAPPPHVDATPATAALGDTFIELAGTGFERVRGLLVDGATYGKDPAATATSACFTGPPLGSRDQLAAGQQLSAQLVTRDGSPGQIFPLTVAPQRPQLAAAAIVPPSSDVRPATDPLSIMVQTPRTLPQQITVRLRKLPDTVPAPCDAGAADPTAVTVPPADVHVRTPSTLAVDMRADLLGDRGFGTLEIRIVDGATKLASGWLALPATFARAPAVTQIACPADASAPCRLYGTELSSIDAIRDAAGTFVAPQAGCPPTDKGVACVYVPHVTRFELRLIDGGMTEMLPDGLITATPQ